MQQTADTDFGFGAGFSGKVVESRPDGQTEGAKGVPGAEVVLDRESRKQDLFAREEVGEVEYFGQEFSQGSVALVERFGNSAFEQLDSGDRGTAGEQTSVALFGFPFEIPGEYEMERRIGIELGPEKIFTAIKSYGLRSIEDPHCKYYEFLSNLPPPGAIILEEATIKVFFSEGLVPFDTVIGLGGGNHLLNTFFAHIDPLSTRRLDYMVKISPKISRKPLLAAKLEAGDTNTPPLIIHNSNYATALNQSAKERLIHFGVLDSECCQAEVDSVVKKDKSSVLYLDKKNYVNVGNFSNLLDRISAEAKIKGSSKTAKLGLMIDCESIKADLIPGVSSPAVFGLNSEELQAILNRCTQPDVQLSALLLTNFNPAIETDRSSRFLAFLIHSLFQAIKDTREKGTN